MSEIADQHAPAHALIRRSRRLPIIWIIPILAVVMGLWLAWDTLSKEGPTITISFDSAEGLQPGQSQLKYKDIVLGTVQSTDLTPDHAHVLVRVATTRQAEPLLNDQTIFWVVKPRLFAGNVSGLETLLSGAYIGMLPAQTAGKAQREFVGHEDPPVLQASVPGHTFLLKASRLGSISLGSPVFFRDLTVGEVLGWDIADMAESVTIRAFVRAPYDRYVSEESKFWNASGVSVKLGAAGVDVQLESLRALLLGGIAFETPDKAATDTAKLEGHVFPLYADRTTANASSYKRKLPLVSYFSGSVSGLGPGSEVTVHGLLVGHVLDVKLVYDPVKDRILAPVRYEVEPERVIGVGHQIYATAEEGVDALVQRGLRASLESANLITGQQVVALDFVQNAPPATVEKDGADFVLPVTAGGGLSGMAASAGELMQQVGKIPFKAIGDNLDGLLRAANEISNGPQLRQALTDLSATLNSVKELTAHLDSGMGPALQQLPGLSAGLQKTMTSVNKLVLSLDNGYGDNTQFSRDLGRLLLQLNDAVRSIRSLADLLARHPEALIKGRTGVVE
ncbi:MAG TPA: MlaD family protein [Acetobacteraceae bacterium]|nr:MlaD family protein [Acetobacteraceae bacterium]